MVLRKIIDNSVRHTPKSKQTKERDNKPKTIKAGSLPPKQNKNISQNNNKIPQKCSSKWICYPHKIIFVQLSYYNICTSIRIIIFENL